MGEVESGVARLREGLEPVVARVTAVRLNAVQELEQLQELLRERSAIRAWRQDIDRTRDAFAASDKVSKLLSRLDASHAAPGAQHLRLDQEARLLERGAAEIARLRFLIRARKDGEDAQPPLVPSLAEEGFPRQGLMAQHGAELTAELEAHSGDLVRKMRAALERALADALPGVAAAAGVGEAGVNGGIEVQGELDGKEQAGAHSAAHHIIHGMRTVGSDDAAQEVVRSALVRPLLNAVTDSASSSGGLPAFLRAAIAVARAACACVCGEAPSRSWGVEDGAHEGDGGAGGMPRHMLLAECVTAEIDSTVAVRFADWTSPGVPERFLGGLEAVVGFLTAAESLCMGKVRLAGLIGGGGIFAPSSRCLFHAGLALAQATATFVEDTALSSLHRCYDCCCG